MTVFWGVVASLIAALIVAAFSGLIGFFSESTKVFKLRDAVTGWLFSRGQSFRNKIRDDPKAGIAFFVRWLKRDQSKSGRFRGQFGRRSIYNKAFQTIPQEPDAKPRLWFTGWPCFVLSEIGQGKRNLAIAARSLRGLLEGGVVWVYQGAGATTSPERQPRIISYRHTMRAAQILGRLGESRELISRIVGRMLDPREKWQNDDQGWAQCKTQFTDSDLWASAYAAALLFDVYQGRIEGLDVLRTQAGVALDKTLTYLELAWWKDGWAYGNGSDRIASEHNGVQIFYEAIGPLIGCRPDFAKTLTSWVESWLAPDGVVSEAYHQACASNARVSNEVRVAYALYLAGLGPGRWLAAYERALEDFGPGVNCVDVSFLCHLTYVRSTSLRAKEAVYMAAPSR